MMYALNDHRTSLVFIVLKWMLKCVLLVRIKIYIYLFMLGMSKAFETVNRVKLFTILRTFLEDDELHIIKVVTENVILRQKLDMKQETI